MCTHTRDTHIGDTYAHAHMCTHAHWRYILETHTHTGDTHTEDTHQRHIHTCTHTHTHQRHKHRRHICTCAHTLGTHALETHMHACTYTHSHTHTTHMFTHTKQHWQASPHISWPLPPCLHHLPIYHMISTWLVSCNTCNPPYPSHTHTHPDFSLW